MSRTRSTPCGSGAEKVVVARTSARARAPACRPAAAAAAGAQGRRVPADTAKPSPSSVVEAHAGRAAQLHHRLRQQLGAGMRRRALEGAVLELRLRLEAQLQDVVAARRQQAGDAQGRLRQIAPGIVFGCMKAPMRSAMRISAAACGRRSRS